MLRRFRKYSIVAVLALVGSSVGLANRVQAQTYQIDCAICCASLAAGQRQFHVPVHALNSSAGSRLGPLSRHCRFGGAQWAHPMIQMPRQIIEVVSTISCSLVRIARDHFCRQQPNLCLLKMPFSTLPDQSLICFRKDLRSIWSKTAPTSTSAAPIQLCTLNPRLRCPICTPKRVRPRRRLQPICYHLPRHLWNPR